MRVISVIEIVDNTVQGIESFGVFEEQLKDDVVKVAEEQFELKARENGLSEDESIDDYIENGYYENGNYAINLVWSYIGE
jgi:hypothetical protein